jgi:hypothetical protein
MLCFIYRFGYFIYVGYIGNNYYLPSQASIYRYASHDHGHCSFYVM